MSAASRPLQADQALGPLTLPPVTRLDLIKYAGASGDFNPIHTIDEAAAAAGLPGVIQHGMLTLARISLVFSPYLDRGFVSRLEVRFTGMVAVGDVLTVGGTVIEVGASGTDQIVRCEVFARNQREQAVITGQADFTMLGSS